MTAEKVAGGGKAGGNDGGGNAVNAVIRQMAKSIGAGVTKSSAPAPQPIAAAKPTKGNQALA